MVGRGEVGRAEAVGVGERTQRMRKSALKSRQKKMTKKKAPTRRPRQAFKRPAAAEPQSRESKATDVAGESAKALEGKPEEPKPKKRAKNVASEIKPENASENTSEEKPKKKNTKANEPEETTGNERPKRSRAPSAAKKSADKTKCQKTSGELGSGDRSEGDKDGGNGKSRTWAGRWIPTEPVALRKMEAIRSVFEEFFAHKLCSQSTFQSPFYKVCVNGFKNQNLDDATTFETYRAAAELEVTGLLQQEGVRAWSLPRHSGTPC